MKKKTTLMKEKIDFIKQIIYDVFINTCKYSF